MQHMQSHYGVTLSEASLEGSLVPGAMLCFGPLVALSVNKLGYKFTGLIGALLVVLGMGVCLGCDDSFPVFLVCYGIVMGLGTGFMYLPSTTCSAFYFKKRYCIYNYIQTM